MNSEKFFNSFLKYYDKINCSDGLQLVWAGIFERYYRNRDMDVPVYKINNPNNSPYTEESLTYFLDEAIDYFRKVMPLIDKSIQTQYLYMVKSDDIYIPMKIENKIQSCLSKIEIENMPFDVDGIEYLVSGNFNGNFDFETDGETVIVSLDFELISITLDGEYVEDEDEWDAIKDEMYDSYSDWYDNVTWNCFLILYENDNFMNRDWMGWNTGIHIIT